MSGSSSKPEQMRKIQAEFPNPPNNQKFRPMMLLDLPIDLVEEVIFKLPVTSLTGLRSSCKSLNTLSKSRNVAKKRKKEWLLNDYVVMIIEKKVCLMKLNLFSPSIEPIAKLDCAVDISVIYHCKGLLLCVIKGDEKLNSPTRLVVWNPFLGQTRWIEPRCSSYNNFEVYALGYDKLLRTHKVLRFVNDYDGSKFKRRYLNFEIYNLDSNSWKVLDDVTPDWYIGYYQRGVSIKGNTYWYAQDLLTVVLPHFLVCFDFTTERFGRLPLPFDTSVFKKKVTIATLSNVGEDQLAVLFQSCHNQFRMGIWISTSNVESWKNIFLVVDMKPLVGFPFDRACGSFYIDEKKKLVVVLDNDTPKIGNKPTRNIAYIIGEKGYFEKVVLGESIAPHCDPLLCSSYIPSSVEIKQTPAPQDQDYI